MRLLCLVFIPLLAWCCTPASARTYQYKDKNGGVHFTNNLSKIPYDQLPDARPIGGEKGDKGTEPNPETSEEEGAAPSEKTPPGTEKGDTAKEGPDIPITREMNKEKAALDAEHARLVKKRKALKKERAALKTPEQVKAYQKKVKELNKQIDAYEERNRAFQKKVDAYNRALAGEEEK